jgi:tetratricopeptide (TPR) repeat protein
MEEKKDFLISYNKADKQWAKWIAAILEAEGYTCIIQAWDFKPGENFVLDMHKALINSERFIAVLSQDYLDSLYCQAEWAAAFIKDPNSEKRLFIPVRVADIEPEGLLAAIIYIDLFGTDEEMAEQRLINGVDVKDIPRNRPSFPGTVKVRFPGSLPFNNLPFIRNAYFTGRDSILDDISKEFEKGNAISLTQAITGLGGIGKTQTALEYAYRNASKYDWIWWVSAETEPTVLLAYREFAIKMKLMNTAQQDAAIIIETVLNWMDTHDQWLFIYDNVDHVNSDTAWWPRNCRGNILITTRNRKVTIGQGIEISIFNDLEAIAFLENRTGIYNDRQQALLLAQRLGCFPLALEQASAYIKNNDITFEDYLILLKDYGLDVLGETEGVIDYTKPLTATWEISFAKIELEAAQQLLYLCAYLAPESIEAEIFSENVELLPSPLKEQLSNTLTANKVWLELTRYSILEKEGDNQSYSMHRLLQEVIRNKLCSEPQWIQCCLSIIRKIYTFEYGNVPSHNRFIKLTPHVEALLNSTMLCLPDDTSQKDIADLYAVGGSGHLHLGNYSQAFEWYQKALAIREKVLGKEHRSTATTYNNISSVYASQGDYPKALEWYQKALAIREKVLGKEHPSTATSYNNIAGVYASQGDYPKALELFQKALAIREKMLGKEHPDTATTYNDIANVYEKQGDYPKALEWYQKDLAISEKVLGKEHPDTAATYNNIAEVYDSQGDYPKALEWYQKALAICEKVLGMEHPSTATTYNNIASVYSRQGDYPKALEWYQKTLAIREKVLGKEHPSTATTYNNISSVYAHQGETPKALEWYQKALAISEKVLGKEHPSTATISNNIAGVYASQGDYPKALEWYQKALAIREKVLGKEHPDTAATYNNIAGVYASQGDYLKALEWYRKALTISEKVLGMEHPSTATTYNNIAGVYDSQGDYPKALEWYQKDLAISEKVLGKEHPDTATTYNNIAGVYAHHGETPKALEWYQKALAICEKVLGKEHPDTATTYNNIAGVYDSQGDYSKALEWFQKALAIHEKVLGKEHPSTAATYNNIAGVYAHQGETPKALEWYQKALAIREKVLGKEHPSTAATYNNIAGVYDKQGDYPKALEWYQKALPILEARLGSNHPYTKSVIDSIHRLQK